MKRLLIAMALIGVASTASTQTLEKAYILAEPLQYTKAGKFRGCGLSLKLLQDTQGRQRDYLTLSINFWLDNPSAALVKTTWSKATPGSSIPLIPEKIESVWARIGQGDPIASQRTMPGEDGALLTIVEIKSAFVFLSDVLSGEKELQVGFKPPGGKFERVFYGIPKVEDETPERVHRCLQEMTSKFENKEK